MVLPKVLMLLRFINALLRGKWTLAWKCWLNPSSTSYWQASTSKNKLQLNLNMEILILTIVHLYGSEILRSRWTSTYWRLETRFLSDPSPSESTSGRESSPGRWPVPETVFPVFDPVRTGSRRSRRNPDPMQFATWSCGWGSGSRWSAWRASPSSRWSLDKLKSRPRWRKNKMDSLY